MGSIPYVVSVYISKIYLRLFGNNCIEGFKCLLLTLSILAQKQIKNRKK